MKEVLKSLVRQVQNGEYLEIRLERTSTTSIRIHNEVVERAKVSMEEGGYVRVLNPRTGWWFSTFQAWENLKERVELGIRSSLLLPRSETDV
ncbi:MAG: PmbA/TldA family metallopeptidase, partial [Candidatus Caldatribacteriaceae bacterium]